MEISYGDIMGSQIISTIKKLHGFCSNYYKKRELAKLLKEIRKFAQSLDEEKEDLVICFGYKISAEESMPGLPAGAMVTRRTHMTEEKRKEFDAAITELRSKKVQLSISEPIKVELWPSQIKEITPDEDESVLDFVEIIEKDGEEPVDKEKDLKHWKDRAVRAESLLNEITNKARFKEQ